MQAGCYWLEELDHAGSTASPLTVPQVHDELDERLGIVAGLEYRRAGYSRGKTVGAAGVMNRAGPQPPPRQGGPQPSKFPALSSAGAPATLHAWI